jgi:hypothetical protein
MADGQQLNSLSRFRKQPGRLVLEEHDHCEVPAGCGGVVLRWRSPLAAVPVTLRLYTPVPAAACAIDGEPVRTGRVDLTPGTHALAVHLKDVELSAGLLMGTATHDPKRYQRTAPAEVVEPPFQLLTAADGTWKFTLDEPPADAWQRPAFDDGSWPALVQAPTPKLDWKDHGSYECRTCADAGAVCLGLPSPGGPGESLPWWQRLLRARPGKTVPLGKGSVWIRKEFVIPAPQESTPGS